jgi:hypothetical protein
VRAALAALVLTLAGCATAAAPPLPPLGGSCRPDGLGDLLGRPADAALGAEALRRSGGAQLRWIRPGDMVTMDYSAARLNVHLDAQGRVEHFACG